MISKGMSIDAIISMVAFLGIVVGGFVYFLYLVIKKNRS